MIAAIIPARGGSKGIPRKNLISISGKPLVLWSIESALASRVDRVIVSSDCHEIGSVAIQAGADWMLRSDETSSDTATTESVIEEVLDTSEDRIEYVVLLQPTSPIRGEADIDTAIELVQDREVDSVFSANLVHGYTWTLDEGVATPNYERRQRRQDQQSTVIEENGSIYAFRVAMFRMVGNRIGGCTVPMIQDEGCRYQIDIPDDVPRVSRELRWRQQLLPYARY